MKFIAMLAEMLLIPVFWLLVFFRHFFRDILGVFVNRFATANYEVKSAYHEIMGRYYEDI